MDSGYLPEEDLPKFKEAASANKWAWAQEDVAEDDDQVPTKVKYGKVSGLIQPVFDILGILPGYRESDISLWFFLFFTLFFAMIIGDAGYGMLILIGTIVFAVKTKGEKKYSQHSLLIICTFNCNRYMGSDYRYLVRNGVSNECSVPESTGNSKLCKLSGLLRSYSSCTAEHDYEVLILCRSNSDGAW